MKLTLLLLLLSTTFSYSQVPINNYFNTSTTNYAIVTSSSTIDESTNGANLVWNFNDLTQTGSTEDTNSTPTSSEIATYPGTTLVVTITDTDTMDENKIFIKEVNQEVSMTGYSSPNLTLNYSTDNALLGTYPSNYNDSTTDDIAGNYTFDTDDGTTYSGTFTGNVVSTVDAYGTLTTNDIGQGGFNGNVTRTISTQNLDLQYSIFGNVGTATLTIYNYYDANGTIVFRSNTTEISVPLISIDQTTTIYESMLSSTLETNQPELASNKIKIFPNPVEDFLNIQTSNNQIIKSITITDITGKEVLKTQENTVSLPVNNLQTGLYLANITTENNYFSLKFIKK